MDKVFRIPRWEELPDVDLYLDQVISFIDGNIGEYVNEDGKKALTKTMVNNYVKQKILQPPQKKKYDKLAVASLIVITMLKSVFSMNQIASLIGLAIQANDIQVSYNQFCEVIEDAVDTVFEGRGFDGKNDLNEAQYILRNVCRTLACTLYIKKSYFEKEDVK